jgi:hypothetical protein
VSLKDLIKINFINDSNHRGKIQKFLKYKEEIFESTKFLPEKCNLVSRLYYIYNDLKEPLYCVSCGDPITQDKFFQKHYCSKSCQLTDKLIDVQITHNESIGMLNEILVKEKNYLNIKEKIVENNLIRLYLKTFHWCKNLSEASYCAKNGIITQPCCKCCKEKLNYRSIKGYGEYCSNHRYVKAKTNSRLIYNENKNQNKICDYYELKKFIVEMVENENFNVDRYSMWLVRNGYYNSLLYYTSNLTKQNRGRKSGNIAEKIYLVYHNLNEPDKCVICGKYSSFISFNLGYSRCCSQKCSKQLIGWDWNNLTLKQRNEINEKRKISWENKTENEKIEIISKVDKTRKKNGVNSSSYLADTFFDLLGLIIEELGVKNDLYFSNINNGEKRIGRYSLDFNYSNKIIEFYGDNVHGNPDKYNSGDVLPYYGKMLVDKKWEKDTIRTNKLEDLGYVVKIVWASDYKNKPTETINNCVMFLTDK